MLLLLLLAATVRRVTAPFSLKPRTYLFFVTIPLLSFCFAMVPRTFTCQHCETSGNTTSKRPCFLLVEEEVDLMHYCAAWLS